MRYLMFVMTDPEPDTDPSEMPDVDAWVDRHDQSGERVLGERVRPAEDATGWVGVGVGGARAGGGVGRAPPRAAVRAAAPPGWVGGAPPGEAIPAPPPGDDAGRPAPEEQAPQPPLPGTLLPPDLGKLLLGIACCGTL